MKEKLAKAAGLTLALLPGLAHAQITSPSSTQIVVDPTIDTILDFISTVGGWFLAAAFILAVVFLVIGGIYYIVSSGDPTRAEKGKKTIIYALIGIAVVVLSYFLVSLISGSEGIFGGL